MQCLHQFYSLLTEVRRKTVYGRVPGMFFVGPCKSSRHRITLHNDLPILPTPILGSVLIFDDVEQDFELHVDSFFSSCFSSKTISPAEAISVCSKSCVGFVILNGWYEKESTSTVHSNTKCSGKRY